MEKPGEYAEKVSICGEGRNSYAKTEYMGNDQLLPAYYVQIGVADKYIAVVDVNSIDLTWTA